MCELFKLIWETEYLELDYQFHSTAYDACSVVLKSYLVYLLFLSLVIIREIQGFAIEVTKDNYFLNCSKLLDLSDASQFSV